MKILVINGPNLNMLGIREPDIYGALTLQELISEVKDYAKMKYPDISLEFFQSNHEGAIIDKIQEAYAQIDGIIINPAAYTHTSVAIADAISAVKIPTVEVHLSDIYAGEEFRKHSYIKPYAKKQISGLGIEGYKQAVDELMGQ